MKYLVIGGTGFIGSHIVRRLVNEGDDVATFSTSGNTSKIKDVANKVQVIRGDFSDPWSLIDAIKKNNVERIIYAAIYLPADVVDPAKIARMNLMGFTNMLEASRLMKVERVVWTSSYAIFGQPEFYPSQPVKEDTPAMPAMLHGACIALNEFLAQEYARLHGIDIITLRLGVVYGPARDRRGIFDYVVSMFEDPAIGKPTRVTDGDMVLTWHYVKDAAKAVVLATKATGLTHRVFNTGFEAKTLREVIGLLKKVLPDAEIEVESGGKLIRPLVDANLAHKELKYSPDYPLEQGVADYIRELQIRR